MTEGPHAAGDEQQASVVTDELVEIFARMFGLLLDSDSVARALRLVTDLAAEVIPGTIGAAVSVIDGTDQRRTTAATDEIAERCDTLQYELNEGPCLAAAASRTLMRVDDTSEETRWARWAEQAAAMGVGSALSAPMVVDSRGFGAIKVYAREPRAFDGHAELLLTLFSNQAAILVANAQAFDRSERLSDRLRESLRSRDAISEARGVLMGRRGMDSETAFITMVATARREETPLLAVAQNIIELATRRSR